MLRIVASLIALAAVVGNCSAQVTRHEPMDEAVDQALEYLAKQQSPDGSWRAAAGKGDAAVTALGVMAFLSAGHVPGEGPYAKTIESGIQYVVASQSTAGLIASQGTYQFEMYEHGICTLMLAEVVGMWPERREAAKLRKRLEAAVALLLRAQRIRPPSAGGWRYHVDSPDADMSVTGWQLMALRAARNVGCDIPAERIDLAVTFIERCRDPSSGGYRYMENSQVTVPCTAVAVLSLELAGKQYHQSTEVLKAASFLLDHSLPNDRHFFYGVYYSSQALFQVGGNYWEQYRGKLHDLLLKNNPQRAGGFWIGRAWDDLTWGPNYCTAMGVLALTVEYRYLPIYQREDDSGEPSGK